MPYGTGCFLVSLRSMLVIVCKQTGQMNFRWLLSQTLIPRSKLHVQHCWRFCYAVLPVGMPPGDVEGGEATHPTDQDQRLNNSCEVSLGAN